MITASSSHVHSFIIIICLLLLLLHESFTSKISKIRVLFGNFKCEIISSATEVMRCSCVQYSCVKLIASSFFFWTAGCYFFPQMTTNEKKKIHFYLKNRNTRKKIANKQTNNQRYLNIYIFYTYGNNDDG